MASLEPALLGGGYDMGIRFGCSHPPCIEDRIFNSLSIVYAFAIESCPGGSRSHLASSD